MTGRRGRECRKLLDDLKERRGYYHLKEEALDRTMWRVRFGGDFGPVVRQTTKWNEWITVVTVKNTLPWDVMPCIFFEAFVRHGFTVISYKLQNFHRSRNMDCIDSVWRFPFLTVKIGKPSSVKMHKSVVLYTTEIILLCPYLFQVVSFCIY